MAQPITGTVKMLSGFDAAGLVDSLTLSVPAGTTYNLKKVEYRSEAGRRSKSRFSDVSMPAPMVFSADSGLVLYERVLAPQHEKQLMEKLSKPRAVHRREQPMPIGPGAPHSNVQHDHSHVSAPSSPAPSNRAPMATYQPSSAWKGTKPPAPVGGIRRGFTPPAVPTVVISETPYSARSRAFDKDSQEREKLASQRYHRGERATMTASTVFTWGGRFKHEPPDPSLSSRESLSVGKRRPPLRL